MHSEVFPTMQLLMTEVIGLPLCPWRGFTTAYSGTLFGEQETVISLCITSRGFYREVGAMLHLEQSETLWWRSGEISCSLVIMSLMGNTTISQSTSENEIDWNRFHARMWPSSENVLQLCLASIYVPWKSMDKGQSSLGKLSGTVTSRLCLLIVVSK